MTTAEKAGALSASTIGAVGRASQGDQTASTKLGVRRAKHPATNTDTDTRARPAILFLLALPFLQSVEAEMRFHGNVLRHLRGRCSLGHVRTTHRVNMGSLRIAA